MGEAQNTTLSGDAKLAVLENMKKLGKVDPDKTYSQLTAAEKLFIDQEYDKVAKTVGSTQVSNA